MEATQETLTQKRSPDLVAIQNLALHASARDDSQVRAVTGERLARFSAQQLVGCQKISADTPEALRRAFAKNADSPIPFIRKF